MMIGGSEVHEILGAWLRVHRQKLSKELIKERFNKDKRMEHLGFSEGKKQEHCDMLNLQWGWRGNTSSLSTLINV
jgi:hypothetical protein